MPHFLPFEMKSLVSQQLRHALADGNCILLHDGLKITLAHTEWAQQQDMLSLVSAVSSEHNQMFLAHVRDVPGKGAVEGVTEVGLITGGGGRND